MKKKQRCLLNRFAALVAALMLCVSLCVPCFASNNAQWRKWVVRAESQMTNEQGSMSRYLQLTPFQNGEVYAATFMSVLRPVSLPYSAPDGSSESTLNSYFMSCLNYPDWWRSAVPLGALSYIQLDVKSVGYSTTPFASSVSPASAAYVYFFDRSNSLSMSLDLTSYRSSTGTLSQSRGYNGSISSSPDSVPLFATSAEMPGGSSGFGTQHATSLRVQAGQSYTVTLSNFANLAMQWPYSTGISVGAGFAPVYLLNLSSDDLIIGVSCADGYYSHMVAEVSFWVDANKLPAGLQVGDEFPADTDAFDQLRDELLDQFPEAAEHIENGKATIQGWNDTETVDTDVASTSISALNALFQNLGGFLFIVSLMVFGAVVLRMLIRKAVDG